MRFTRRVSVSLRRRLAVVALATTAVWVGLLSATFILVLTAQLRGQADQLLRTRAAAVAATVDVRPDGRLVVHEPADDSALDVGTWIYQGTTVIERPIASTQLQADADRLAAHRSTYAETAQPHAARLYALPLTSGGRQVGTVIASVGLDPYRSITQAVLAGSVVFALLLLAGSYPVTRMIVGRALRPVRTMSAQAARWSRDGTARRFEVDGRPVELAGLATNLNTLLDRLAAVLRHEQQLTAELSHELRTPLARITAETDWLTAHPRTDTERHDAHQAIAASATAMREICETLLADARSLGGQRPETCLVPDVVRQLARQHAAHHPEAVPVTVVGPPVHAELPAALLQRMLSPLLDNASRYARRHITVDTTQRAGTVEIRVEDDGPGIPAELGAAVFEPGWRADSTDDHDGAGLGLALARRLARSAGGDITLAESAAGARFVVSLPAE